VGQGGGLHSGGDAALDRMFEPCTLAVAREMNSGCAI
jgi:hypothetical protein